MFKLLMHFTAATLLAILVLGCASTPAQRFPNVSAQLAANNHVDLYIDVSILSDISGEYPGFNKEMNQASLAALKKSVLEQMESHQFQVASVRALSGISVQATARDQRVDYSKDWESTGQRFETALDEEGLPAYIEPQSCQFLTELAVKSRDISYSKPSARKKRWAKKKGIDPNDNNTMQLAIPDSFQSSNNLVGLVRLHGTQVPTGKSVGIGILTGVLSAVVSGGTYIAASSPVSTTQLEFVLFDPVRHQVLWQNSLPYTHDLDAEDDIREATADLFESLEPIGGTTIVSAK